jgi:hypothetical protein
MAEWVDRDRRPPSERMAPFAGGRAVMLHAVGWVVFSPPVARAFKNATMES